MEKDENFLEAFRSLLLFFFFISFFFSVIILQFNFFILKNLGRKCNRKFWGFSFLEIKKREKEIWNYYFIWFGCILNLLWVFFCLISWMCVYVCCKCGFMELKDNTMLLYPLDIFEKSILKLHKLSRHWSHKIIIMHTIDVIGRRY